MIIVMIRKGDLAFFARHANQTRNFTLDHAIEKINLTKNPLDPGFINIFRAELIVLSRPLSSQRIPLVEHAIRNKRRILTKITQPPTTF